MLALAAETLLRAMISVTSSISSKPTSSASSIDAISSGFDDAIIERKANSFVDIAGFLRNMTSP